MKIISKVVWVILFIVFFGFALKNTQEAALRFFWGYEITGPLALLLLGVLVVGFVLGILAMTPTFFRHRRELSRQKKTIATMQHETAVKELARMQPPQPDTVVSK